MAGLTTRLSLIEDMSAKMEAIAESGFNALNALEQIGTTADNSTRAAATAADGVAVALDSVTDSANEALSATDSWTSAVGSYDKSALEAIYTTEDLVDMGLKSADALSEQEAMFALCEQSAEQLSQSLESATVIEDQLAAAQEEAAQMSEALAEADGVSSEAKEEYTRAVEEAAQAMEELSRAQEEANAAMENYTSVIDSGTTDLNELEAAAEQAGHAAENLSAANGKASAATDDLSSATKSAGEELENAGEKGADAISELENILATAGITVMLKEMAEAAYDLADAFSEAEKVVVLATGATGDSLMDLESSMMSVYSTAKSADLSTTAGAIGEINTRLGLTGNQLELTTGMFLDYANVTNQSVVPAVSSVTKVMNQWGIELDGLPGLLDELTYAGQMSGINVGTLSDQLVSNKGVLQSLGFTLEDSIGLFAQLELQTGSAQTIMTGFRTALNNFANEGLTDAHAALEAVVDEIVNAKTESEATAIAVDNFGSKAGAQLASSLRNGQVSIDDLTSSLSGAEGALETTATASQTMGEKLQQSSNNIKSAFTEVLQPEIEKASTFISNMMNGIGNYLKENPSVTKAITAVATAVGLFTASVVAAKIAMAAFNAVMDMNPIFLAVSAITAATVALASYAFAAGEAADHSDELCYASRRQAEEIENLTAQYDAVCETYGETSDQAYDLQYQIEYLSGQFEANKKTIGEYIQEIEDLHAAWNDSLDSCRDTYEQVDINENKTLALVRQLERLANQQNITTESEMEMKTIIQELNKELPTLNLNYEDIIKNADSFASSVESIVKAKAATQRYEAALEGAATAQTSLLDSKSALEQYTVTHGELTTEVATLKAEYDRLTSAYNNWIGSGGRGTNPYKANMDRAKTAYETTNQELVSLEGEIEKVNGDISRAQGEYDDYIAKLTEMGDATNDAFASAQTQEDILNAMAQAVSSLSDEYNEAYNAALTSFSGQFGLFDEAQANMDATVANAQAALDSQLDYWNTYLANVNILKETSASDLGITQANYDALMAYVQDGSAEAAGLAQSMVDAISSGDEEAVADLANTLAEVQSKQEEAASAVAEWQINFSAEMDKIVQKANQAVTEMNLSSEAEKAGRDTIDAYVNAINAEGGRAIAAAASIAARVQSELSSISITIPSTTGKGYAEGTDYATPGPHLVGENGPEIVEFRGGEKVYDNDETERIMARSAALQYFAQPDGGIAVQGGGGSGSAVGSNSNDTKTIRLEINGAGSIDITNGVDEETVVAIMQSNLKPVLTSIVRQEIYEEGDYSYDY